MLVCWNGGWRRCGGQPVGASWLRVFFPPRLINRLVVCSTSRDWGANRRGEMASLQAHLSCCCIMLGMDCYLHVWLGPGRLTNNSLPPERRERWRVKCATMYKARHSSSRRDSSQSSSLLHTRSHLFLYFFFLSLTWAALCSAPTFHHGRRQQKQHRICCFVCQLE